MEALAARCEEQIDRPENQARQLTRQVESLTAQVEKLTPRNSSLPPSAEHPHGKPKLKHLSAKKRKQGGQNGHRRHLRELIFNEQCATVTPCHPDGVLHE